MVQEMKISHIPPSIHIYATLITSLRNAPHLRAQLLAGNTSFEYAFIDAATIISTTQIFAAVFRSINDWSHDRLKSRNIHSEIVFALNPNNNIGEAFRRFGVQEGTKDVVVLKVSSEDEVTLESVQRFLREEIEGEEVAFDDSEFRKVADLGRIRKVYKINAGGLGEKKLVNGRGGGGENVDERVKLERHILGLMALRGAT